MDEVYETIEFSLKYRMYENALLLCQDFFDRFPSSRFLHLYARVYMESGFPTQASLLISKYSNLINDNPEIVLLYAQSYFESGKYSIAESILKQFNTLNIRDKKLKKQLLISYHYLLGLIKKRTHRHVLAKNDFLECYKESSLMISVLNYLNLSDIHSIQKMDILKIKPVSIYRIVKLMTNINPLEDITNERWANSKDLIITIKEVALYYFYRSKYTEAASIFRQLYEIHPYCTDGMDIYSTVLWQLKDVLALNELSRRVMEIAPNRPESFIVYGNFLSLQQKNLEAIQMFERAASISKSCSYSLALAGHEYLLLDMIPKAAELFRSSLDRNPYEWSAWYGLGEVQFRLENFAAAEYYMKKSLEINPTSSILHYIYSLILRKCGKDDQAQTMLDKSLQLDPNNVIAKYQKGVLLYDHGKLNDAQDCLNSTSALAAHEPSISLLKGKIAQQLNNGEESLSYFIDAEIFGYKDQVELSTNISGMIDQMVDKIIQDHKNKNEG